MRTIVFTHIARGELKDIFEYWNTRNGSDTYSRRLAKQINDALATCAAYPDAALNLPPASIQYTIVGYYAIYYDYYPNTLVVHHIWDQRRNPEDHPLNTTT